MASSTTHNEFAIRNFDKQVSFVLSFFKFQSFKLWLIHYIELSDIYHKYSNKINDKITIDLSWAKTQCIVKILACNTFFFVRFVVGSNICFMVIVVHFNLRIYHVHVPTDVVAKQNWTHACVRGRVIFLFT